jgi:hypothetical protein
MLPTKFRFIWQSGFRGEDFLEINQSEARIALGGDACYELRRNEQSVFYKDCSFSSDLLTNMATIGNSCF